MFVVYFVVISSSISKYQLQNTKCSSGISLPSTAEISVTVTQKTATSTPDITDSESGIRDQNMAEYGITHYRVWPNIKQIFQTKLQKSEFVSSEIRTKNKVYESRPRTSHNISVCFGTDIFIFLFIYTE
jgi:hypothetical protein